jgi:hypothetical protein
LSSTQALSASAASTCFLKSLLNRLAFNPAAQQQSKSAQVTWNAVHISSLGASAHPDVAIAGRC